MPKANITRQDIHDSVYANITKAITLDGGTVEHGKKFYEVVSKITQAQIEIATKLIDAEEQNERFRAYIQRNEVRV